jgi:hypothetical protein
MSTLLIVVGDKFKENEKARDIVRPSGGARASFLGVPFARRRCRNAAAFVVLGRRQFQNQ